MQSIDLHSPLPSTLRPLKNLITLISSSTNLTGNIPKEWEAIRSLTLINISNNEVLGKNPWWTLYVKQLRDSSICYIEGSIPLCILHCDLCCVNCVCFSNRTLDNTRILYLFVIYNKSIVKYMLLALAIMCIYSTGGTTIE